MFAKKTRHINEKLYLNIGTYAIYVVILLLALTPLSWIILTSLKNPSEMFAYPPVWLPKNWFPSNYVYLLQRTLLSKQMVNSFIVSISSVTLALSLGSLAAYGFSRFSFRYKYFWMVLLLGLQLLPTATNIVPIYLMANRLHLLNNYLGPILILSATRVPFTIWIVKTSFDTIPVSIEESALIDGASRLGILLRIVLPLALPGLAAASVFNFITTWKEFLIPFILIGKSDIQMATVGIYAFRTAEETAWHLIAAGSVLTSLPVIIVYLFLQRLFIAGMTRGTGK